MEKKEIIQKLDAFLDWYRDNFGTETFILERESPIDGQIEEKTIGYLELPEFEEACKALDALENQA